MRRFFSGLLCFAALLFCAPLAFAANYDIQDDAQLLTHTECVSLEARAQRIADEYDIAVVILTVES